MIFLFIFCSSNLAHCRMLFWYCLIYRLLGSCAGWAPGDSVTDQGQQADSTSLVFKACRDDRLYKYIAIMWHQKSWITMSSWKFKFLRHCFQHVILWHPTFLESFGWTMMDVEWWDAVLISGRIPSGCNRSFQRLSIFRRILIASHLIHSRPLGKSFDVTVLSLLMLKSS